MITDFSKYKTINFNNFEIMLNENKLLDFCHPGIFGVHDFIKKKHY